MATQRSVRAATSDATDRASRDMHAGMQVLPLAVARGSEHEPIGVTLLELVGALADVTDDEREIVATVRHMLETGRVRLTGAFRNEPLF